MIPYNRYYLLLRSLLSFIYEWTRPQAEETVVMPGKKRRGIQKSKGRRKPCIFLRAILEK